MTNVVKVGLIRGRHPLPVDRYLIDTPDVDFSRAHIIAREAMKGLIAETGCQDEIHLYITGLTRATLGAISAFVESERFGSGIGRPEGSFRVLRVFEWNAQTGEYESVIAFRHSQSFLEMADCTNCFVVPVLS